MCEDLAVDWELQVWKRQTTRCDCCGGQRVVYTGEVVDPERTVAMYSAFLYDHADGREVFIDAIFGTWGTDDHSGHVSFGSRTGPIDGHPHNASSLVTGAEMAPDEAMYGQKLTRDQALVHPLLDDFWRVNDMVLTGVPEIEGHLNGAPTRKRSWFRRR